MNNNTSTFRTFLTPDSAAWHAAWAGLFNRGFNPCDFMYMGTTESYHHFKNVNTRQYRSVAV